MTTTIPMPKEVLRLATNKRNGVGMNLLGPRYVEGLGFHRALSGEGSADSVADWLLRSDVQGLTDLSIDARTAKFIRMVRLAGKSTDISGWANGPYNEGWASADGKAYKQRYDTEAERRRGGFDVGASVINMDIESAEINLNYDSPISEACKAVLTQWTAARAQERGIPSTDFPIRPDTGRTFIFGHREWCGTQVKICPGPVVWAFINGELIERVRDVLALAERGKNPLAGAATSVGAAVEPDEPETTYAPAHIPTFIRSESELPVAQYNGRVYLMVTDQYRTVKVTPRYQYADITSARVGPDIPVGEDFNVAFITEDNDGRWWGLTPYGTRVPLDHLERVSDQPMRP